MKSLTLFIIVEGCILNPRYFSTDHEAICSSSSKTNAFQRFFFKIRNSSHRDVIDRMYLLAIDIDLNSFTLFRFLHTFISVHFSNYFTFIQNLIHILLTQFIYNYVTSVQLDTSTTADCRTL